MTVYNGMEKGEGGGIPSTTLKDVTQKVLSKTSRLL